MLALYIIFICVMAGVSGLLQEKTNSTFLRWTIAFIVAWVISMVAWFLSRL